MCGIVGYIGSKNAIPILIQGLRRLEYRGYDSAGVAIRTDSGISVCKEIGPVDNLVSSLDRHTQRLDGRSGIAHTRWATHGEPTQVNAHPHTDCTNMIYVVHNGVIENERSLKEYLKDRGHVFVSDTDTELVAHLIEDIDLPEILDRVRFAVQRLVGTYGLIVMSVEHPNELIAVRQGSPLLIGSAGGEHFVASDATAVIEHTRLVHHMADGQIARVRRDGYDLYQIASDNGDLHTASKHIEEITWSLEELEKGGFEHYMLKEIYDQPDSLKRGMGGRLSDKHIVLGGVAPHLLELLAAPSIILTACGTSWHAALIGEILLEEIAGIPSEVKYASELANLKSPKFQDGSVAIVISQSGETKDTDKAVERLQALGYLCLGVVNVVGSTIARRIGSGIYIHAGPENAVASTKAFTSQVLSLTMLAYYLGTQNGHIKRMQQPDWPERFLNAMREIPKQVRYILDNPKGIRSLAQLFHKHRNFMFLGRGINFPTALEGALKLKEISYIHAEGYPAAEMKHGPIALIDTDMPSVVVALDNDDLYEKICSNMKEIRSRKGVVIAVANQNDTKIVEYADYILRIPETSYFLTPILASIPLQLLAYHMAVARECNVDRPKNLAKSVTVE